MAKKKTTKKSSNRKTVKNRTTNKKVVKKRKKAKKVPAKNPVIYTTHVNCLYLHRAKIKIMEAVPVMPCTVISKDHNGRLFAHTQAEEIYKVYREQCIKHELVTRRIEGCAFDAERPGVKRTEDGGGWEACKESCTRYEGAWEICHVGSGDTETFKGAGDGDNDIWSINSAQTVAKKCGLLDYFEVAWPQPTDWLKVIKDSIGGLPPEETKKALFEIIPDKIMTATSIGEELIEYFNKILAKSKKGK